MKIYIAHPFDSRNKVKRWLKRIKTRHHLVNPFFPMRKYELFKETDKSNENYYKKIIRHSKEIVNADIELIKKCDSLLAIIDGSISYGTIMEIVYAHLLKKKIYIVCTNGHSKHPWLFQHSDKIFKTFKQTERWLKKI